MGLRKTITEAVVDSRKGEFSVVKRVVEQHVVTLGNRKAEFNEIAGNLMRYEQMLYEAVAAHNADLKTNPDQQKRAHELVVAAEAELKKIKQKTDEFKDHLKFE